MNATMEYEYCMNFDQEEPQADFYDMTVERKRLIREIAPCPSIWDTRLFLRGRRHEVRRDWLKVSRAVKLNVDTCKRKWKVMRNTFRNELRRVAHTGIPSRWYLFKDMLFMRDAFVPSPFALSRPDHVFPTEESSVMPLPQNPNPIGPDETAPDCVQDGMPEDMEPKPSGSAQNPKVDPNGSSGRAQNPEVDTNDSDYRFVISLMPFVSTLSKSQKNHFQDEALSLLLQLQTQYPNQVEEKEPEVIHELNDDDEDDHHYHQQYQNQDAVEEQPEEECELEDQLYEQLQEQLRERN